MVPVKPATPVIPAMPVILAMLGTSGMPERAVSRSGVYWTDEGEMAGSWAARDRMKTRGD